MAVRGAPVGEDFLLQAKAQRGLWWLSAAAPAAAALPPRANRAEVHLESVHPLALLVQVHHQVHGCREVAPMPRMAI